MNALSALDVLRMKTDKAPLENAVALFADYELEARQDGRNIIASLAAAELAAKDKELATLRAERDEEKYKSDRLVTVVECLISMIGNVNTVEILMPKVFEILKEQGYGHLADGLAMTGFAAALEKTERTEHEQLR